MKLIVSELRALGGYVSREFYQIMSDLMTNYDWRQIDTWELWNARGSLNDRLRRLLAGRKTIERRFFPDVGDFDHGHKLDAGGAHISKVPGESDLVRGGTDGHDVNNLARRNVEDQSFICRSIQHKSEPSIGRWKRTTLIEGDDIPTATGKSTLSCCG